MVICWDFYFFYIFRFWFGINFVENRSGKLKLQYIEEYEDIGQFKVKVLVYFFIEVIIQYDIQEGICVYFYVEDGVGFVFFFGKFFVYF